MIKSKIDARERALELAVEFCKGQTGSDELVVRCAEGFKSFLIGDAELPEVTDDNAHIKELLEIANKSFDNSRKCNNDKMYRAKWRMKLITCRKCRRYFRITDPENTSVFVRGEEGLGMPMLTYNVTMSVFDKLSAGKSVEEFPNPRVKGCDGVRYHIIDGVEITVKRMSKDEVEWYIKRDGDFVIMSSSDGFFPTDLVAGVANRIYNENTELSQHTGYIRSCNTGSASNCFKLEKYANAVAILRNVGYNVVEL